MKNRFIASENSSPRWELCFIVQCINFALLSFFTTCLGASRLKIYSTRRLTIVHDAFRKCSLCFVFIGHKSYFRNFLISKSYCCKFHADFFCLVQLKTAEDEFKV